GERDRALEAAVAGGVLTVGGAEHATALVTHDGGLLGGDLAGRLPHDIGVLDGAVAPGQPLRGGVALVGGATEAGALGVHAVGLGCGNGRVVVGHASRFLPSSASWSCVVGCSSVGVAPSAAFSAARAAATRLTPKGGLWICSCRVMIALSSIS